MDFNTIRNSTTISSTDASSLSVSHAIGGPYSDSEGFSSAHYENGMSSTSGRRTSRVWRYFRMVDNCHYVCCLCSFVGAYTNTTNMRKHIQNHHPEIFQDILDHTRPTNRLHYLRPIQPQLFQNQYQQPFLNSNLSIQSLQNSHTTTTPTSNNIFQSVTNIPQYSEVDRDDDSENIVTAEEVDSSSMSAPQSFMYPPKESFWEKEGAETEKNSILKTSNCLVKTETNSDVSDCYFGDDRKMDSGGFAGLSESSAGSGDNQGTCDEVSIPLSPEQFMSEETEQGGRSPNTPPPQRPESYKLRHNNHLNLVLESLAGDESFMDVTLTAQGKAIKAHKSVLSAVSPYFRSVLKENPCQHPIIIMPRDIRFEELNSIISYVYKGEMTVAAEDLSSLLKTAEILQVTGLSPSDTNGGSAGIMNQMQGIPAGIMPNTPSKKYSKQKSNAHQMLQQQQLQQQQQDEDDDDSMNEDVNDPQGRVDPLEFLNADMTCVKEEIQSDNEDDSENTSLPVATSGSNDIADTTNVSDSSNASPNRRKSASGSPKPVEDITSKPFNPGEPGGSTSADNSLSDTPTSTVPFMCPHCLDIHRPMEAMQSHLRLKHPSKPAFVCACGRVFLRVMHLTEHSKRCNF